jgi:asparagine synthase (glutamine-hydrolysing)
VQWEARARALVVGCRTLELLGSDEGVRVGHPLIHPGFVEALAAAGRRRGLGDRTAVLTALAGDLLDPAILGRVSKATFGEVFWGRHSRAFAEGWTGNGVDESLVRPDALRAAWLGDPPHPLSNLLLQAAWLRSGGDAP